MIDQLTNWQAYTTICFFPDALCEHISSEDLAGFQLLPDETSSDPAVWQDWMIAVSGVLSEKGI